MKYRLILFDLGRVLVDFEQDLIARRLIERSKKKFEDILELYRNTNLFHDFECGKITPEETLKMINSMLDLRMGMAEFKPLWCDIFFENPGIEEFVDRLRKQHRLFIVSDTNILHYEFILERFPIVRKFEKHILSYKVGVRKPDPKIFEAALREGGVSAAEAIFIDDKEINVEGAMKLGITGILHHSIAETEKELKRLGLLHD